MGSGQIDSLEHLESKIVVLDHHKPIRKSRKVIQVKPGSVDTEVVLEIPGGAHIVSIITKESAENLEVAVGKQAYAIIKASSVMIGID
jgi:molybdopterin-binding protein